MGRGVFFALGGFAAKADAACASRAFDGADYVVCAFDARRDEMRLFWRGAEGSPYANFSTLATALKKNGRALRFAMNAGMYEAICRRSASMSKTARRCAAPTRATARPIST